MKVFTTGQVAKICKVAPRTVSKWFDSGRLKGYRIPGSQDRRIPREYLIKFLKEHGMPLGDLEDEAMAKVLVVGQDQVLIENLKRHMPADGSYKIQVAASGFEAGIQAESFHPDCIVVDYAIGRIDAQHGVAATRHPDGRPFAALWRGGREGDVAIAQLVDGEPHAECGDGEEDDHEARGAAAEA